MKSKVQILLFTLLLISSTSFGQFSFGGKIGGASTSLTGVGLKDFIPEPKVKFIGGGIINYSFGRRFALQAELLYSAKGAAFSYTVDNYLSIYQAKISMEQKLGYFGVPFMLQFKMGDKEGYFHLDAGLVYNTLIHEKYSGSVVWVDEKGKENKKDYPIVQSPSASDMGYAFGIGLMANGINFDFRLEFGTNEVFKPEKSSSKILNKSFQVSAGYTIRY